MSVQTTKEKGRLAIRGGRFAMLFRQLPTLPRSFPRSTISSRGLNFRVRDGNGCDPSDLVTGKPDASPIHLARRRRSGAERFGREARKEKKLRGVGLAITQ